MAGTDSLRPGGTVEFVNAPTGAAGALLDARYRVGPVIARGGMSTVYRGTDTRLDRPVAIKIMDPRLADDPAFRARFEREARSAARIDHPAVVDVHDQGEDLADPGGAGPVLFLVMELVEGGTLRDVLAARGALGVPAALAVLEPVLAGLAQAHRLGLVHRDVKPENVLIGRRGEVKIADFGLVTAAAQAGSSHVGMIVGTMAYLSPEQVATGAADARSDVYAAGVLLYELLTGTPPYTGGTALSVAYRHVNSDVPAPSLIAGEVPPELDELVRTATRRDPAARPADAAAFLEALRRVRERLAVPWVPIPVPPERHGDEQDTLPAPLRRADPTLVSRTPEGWVGAAGPGGTRTLGRAELDPPRGGGDHSVSRAGAGTRILPDHRAVRRRGRRIFAAWIAVILLLGLLVATAAWWLGTGRWTSMPSVVGLERSVAQRLLTGADLVGTVTEEHHDTVAADRVAATDFAPDSPLLRGSAVQLIVSTGRPVVPAVASGVTVTAAEQTVRDADLTPVRSSTAVEYSAGVPAGAVLRTDPPAGTALPIGGAVTLVTSRGQAPRPPPASLASPTPTGQVGVPSVVGETAKEAASDLAKAGLTSSVRSGSPFGSVLPFRSLIPFGSLLPSGGDSGRVASQNPPAGATVPPGTTITLTTR